MHYWFFGIPGVGKSELARLFSQMARLPRYEGDEFHTDEDRQAVAAGAFTLEHRFAQLERISAKLQADGAADAVITHPLPDRESRARVRLTNNGAVQLIHITAPLTLTRAHLAARVGHHFGPELLDPWLKRHWQEPEDENCVTVLNRPGAPFTAQLRQLIYNHLEV